MFKCTPTDLDAQSTMQQYRSTCVLKYSPVATRLLLLLQKRGQKYPLDNELATSNSGQKDIAVSSGDVGGQPICHPHPIQQSFKWRLDVRFIVVDKFWGKPIKTSTIIVDVPQEFRNINLTTAVQCRSVTFCCTLIVHDSCHSEYSYCP